MLALLKPCPDDALKIWPVGKAVGNVKNTGQVERLVDAANKNRYGDRDTGVFDFVTDSFDA
ncbi:MAG: hypothetical protein WB495_11600 [Xanthobacteraceae bacterium]